MTGRVPFAWGTTPADLQRPWPADEMLEGPTIAMDRAVSVAAPVDVAWRWLCQLAVAPYSYDLVDNLGRRSPQELTPGAEDLRVGQRILMVYDLTDVEPGRQWSGITRTARLPLAVTYAAVPDPVPDAELDAGAGPAASRLVCRMVVRDRGARDRAVARALAWGDLVMMRRQLLNLKALAERDAARR